MPMIIIVIDRNGGEVQGSEELALELNTSKYYVRAIAQRLARLGEITICRSCGGRGNKTVYKRNRNQPGLARRTR
jgi:DNA-binding IscR family transcriptional regulator